MPHNIHSFEELPPRVAYVDPSFFIMMSNLGLDEIWYVLLKLLAMRDYGKKGQNILKKEPDVVKKYSEEIEKYTLTLLGIPNLLLAEISVDQTMLSLNLMKKYGIFPRDAIHASCTIASRIGNVITTDSDFKRIEELEVYTCNY